MTIAALVIATLALIAAAAAPAAALVRRSRRDRQAISDLHGDMRRLEHELAELRRELPLGPPLANTTVVINTRKPDDQTIRGVLHGQYADRWTLRDAVYVTGVGEQPVGKLVHVLVENIAFAQEIER